MALQIRRGTNKERLGFTPVEGEIVYVTDSQLATVVVTTIDGTTETMTTAVPHSLTAGQQVKFISNTANGLTENAVYYVIASGLTTGVFKVSTTLNGSAVNLTTGSGLTLQFAVGPTDAAGVPIGNSVAPCWLGDGITTGGLAAGASTLDELADVSIGVNGLDGVTLDNNHMLQYNSTRNQWENRGNITIPGSLNVYGNTTLRGAMTTIGDQTSDQITLTAQNLYAPNNLVVNGPSANHIFVEYATGFVGIGDGTPSYKLDVAGSIRSTSNIIANGDLTVDGNTTLGNANTDTITLNATAVSVPNGLNIDSDTLVIDAVNNWVGIGRDPSAKLDVEGSIRARGTAITADGDVAVNGGDLTTTATTFNLVNGTATTVNFAGGATALALGGAGTTTSASGIVHVTNTTESTNQDSGALRVDGGVGINKHLHVGGSVAIDNTDQATSIYTGSFQTDGGAGIAGNLYVGGLGDVQGNLGVGGNLTVTGNLTVNGTTTTVNSTTLTVDDKNIELGSTATPSDAAADGGGITLKGTTDKTITWSNTSTRWESNVGFDATAGKFGNVDIARSTNDNTISTTSGNLLLNAATGLVQTEVAMQIDGNLDVIGQLHFHDNFPVFNYGVTGAPSTNAGIAVNRGTSADVVFRWNETNDRWESTVDGTNYIELANQGLDTNDNPSFAGATLGGITVGIATDTSINAATGDLVISTDTGQITVSPATELVVGGPTTVNGYTSLFGGVSLGFASTDLIEVVGSVDSDIAFQQPSSGYRGIRGTSGTNDFWFVGGSQTGADQGFLQLSTGDNGSEPIYVRQYTGNPTSGTIVRTAKLLDESGNTSVPGTFTATGIISTQGTEVVLNSDVTSTPADNCQIRVERGTSTDAVLVWKEDVDRWAYGVEGTTLYMPNQQLDTTSDVQFDDVAATNLSVTGAVSIDSHARLTTYELVTSATTADQTLVSISATTYRSAKYQIQIESGTEYQSMEALVVHNGTTAYITIYADIKTGADLATVGVTLLSGNIVLQVTPTNAVTTFRVVETAVKAA